MNICGRWRAEISVPDETWTVNCIKTYFPILKKLYCNITKYECSYSFTQCFQWLFEYLESWTSVRASCFTARSTIIHEIWQLIWPLLSCKHHSWTAINNYLKENFNHINPWQIKNSCICALPRNMPSKTTFILNNRFPCRTILHQPFWNPN